MKLLAISFARAIVFPIVISLASCGGGGGGGSAGGEVPPIAESQAARSGTVYPAIEGMYYQTATSSGYLDKSGSFTYKPGEQVSLSIGGVELANVPADTNVSLLDLDNTTASTNLARVLKALDVGIASTPQTIQVAKLPNTNLTTADLTTEPTTTVALAAINPTAVLPIAANANVVAIVDASKSKTTALTGSAGGVYDLYDFSVGPARNSTWNANPPPCVASTPRVTAGSITLSSAPDWNAGTISGSASLTYSDANPANFTFNTTNGSFQRGGKNYTYQFLHTFASAGRIIEMQITDPSKGNDPQLCGGQSLVFRDSKRPNKPPIAGFNTEASPGIAAGLSVGAGTSYTFTSDWGDFSTAFFSPSHDPDGRVVSLTWTSSKGNRSLTNTPAGHNSGSPTFTEIVYPGERVTITLTAVDDEGAKSTKTTVINANSISTEDAYALIAGKTYAMTIPSFTDQFYVRLNSTKTTFTEWAADGGNSCASSSYDANQGFFDMSKVIFSGSNFSVTTDAGVLQLTQVSGLPSACANASVVPTPTPSCIAPKVLQNGICITPYSLAGTWVGTWNWSGPSPLAPNCTFVDGGAFAITLTQSGTIPVGLTAVGILHGSTIYADGVQTRNLATCELTSTVQETGGSITGDAGSIQETTGAGYFTELGIGGLHFSGSIEWHGNTLTGRISRGATAGGPFTYGSGTLTLTKQ